MVEAIVFETLEPAPADATHRSTCELAKLMGEEPCAAAVNCGIPKPPDGGRVPFDPEERWGGTAHERRTT